ncbi:hypothetical protein Syncc8109_1123 [Synechococcus sp. WH 8109]|nr:hypothetical protein Syncc8109_1123 [Synechococcus sp. WH 8109]
MHHPLLGCVHQPSPSNLVRLCWGLVISTHCQAQRFDDEGCVKPPIHADFLFSQQIN